MIKLTFCLVRLPSLSRAEFQDYWINSHAPLVRSVSEMMGILRYVQTHSLPDDINAGLRIGRDGPASFDGVAQLWYESLEDLESRLRNREVREAGKRLIEDEKKFIDLPKSPLWWGNDQVIIAAD